MKKATHYQCDEIAKSLNCSLNKQITRLKKITKKLKKTVDKINSKFKNNI